MFLHKQNKLFKYIVLTARQVVCNLATSAFMLADCKIIYYCSKTIVKSISVLSFLTLLLHLQMALHQLNPYFRARSCRGDRLLIYLNIFTKSHDKIFSMSCVLNRRVNKRFRSALLLGIVD